MPAEALKCKECHSTYELDASYVCEQCFGPLEVSYDHSDLDDPAALRRKIQAGPASIWRYSDFLPFPRRPQTALDGLAHFAGLFDFLAVPVKRLHE